jgi:hypothetical protein
VRIASATLDLAETLTTRRPFAASTSFSFMADLRAIALPASYCRAGSESFVRISDVSH